MSLDTRRARRATLPGVPSALATAGTDRPHGWADCRGRRGAEPAAPPVRRAQRRRV